MLDDSQKRTSEKSLNSLKAINLIAGRPRGKRNARFFIIVIRALMEVNEMVDNTTLSALDLFRKGLAPVITGSDSDWVLLAPL